MIMTEKMEIEIEHMENIIVSTELTDAEKLEYIALTLLAIRR